MTENELRRLTPAERQSLPRHVAEGAVLTTRDDARDILTTEGWEFVATDDRLEDEPDRDPTEDSEVWRRQVGGRVEWCELNCVLPPPELPEEQCWHRAMWPCDPRLIED